MPSRELRSLDGVRGDELTMYVYGRQYSISPLPYDNRAWMRDEFPRFVEWFYSGRFVPEKSRRAHGVTFGVGWEARYLGYAGVGEGAQAAVRQHDKRGYRKVHYFYPPEAIIRTFEGYWVEARDVRIQAEPLEGRDFVHLYHRPPQTLRVSFRVYAPTRRSREVVQRVLLHSPALILERFIPAHFAPRFAEARHNYAFERRNNTFHLEFPLAEEGPRRLIVRECEGAEVDPQEGSPYIEATGEVPIGERRRIGALARYYFANSREYLHAHPLKSDL